ncbi:MAG: hypothetical protein ACREIP_09610, partial [Alphaproteobacteria bacterium]
MHEPDSDDPAKRGPAKRGEATEIESNTEAAGAGKPQGGEADTAAPAVRKPTSFTRFVAAWCQQQNLAMPRLHRRIAGWLGKKRAETKPKRLLLLAFRGAGKSTLVGLFAAWLLARDPALRILTLSADLALARKMVRNVKRLIESHPDAQGLKPKRPELWGAEEFT